MYAILFPNDELSTKRFATQDAGIAHIRRFFREEDGDLCIVVPVPYTGE
jgi:hypothetical protein